MIVVRLTDGLGNQLFQYALGRRLALDRGVPLKLDLGAYKNNPHRRFELDRFHLLAELATPLELALLRSRGRFRRGLYNRLNRYLPLTLRRAYSEARMFEYDPAVLRLGRTVYLSGYWQSYRYFESINAVLRREFTLKETPDAANQAMGQQIRAVNAVSLHIRRGDYLSPGNQWLGAIPLDYYERAIRLIATSVPSPHFFVFSDQPGWARENLHVDYPTTFVDHNDVEHGYEDLRLMSLCRHHIIANSTLSWWGAWLSRSPDQKVVAPTPWAQQVEYPTPDLFPPEWYQLERFSDSV